MSTVEAVLPISSKCGFSSLDNLLRQHPFRHSDPSVTVNWYPYRRKSSYSYHPSIIAAFGKWRSVPKSEPASHTTDEATKDDFVSRVLKENPSQVQPRFLVGEVLYTGNSKEKVVKWFKCEDLWKKQTGGVEHGSNERPYKERKPVYLKDLLRDYKGKLYVPQQVFSTRISEEEEFDRNWRELPVMCFEDFRKHSRSDKVRLLTEEGRGRYGGWFQRFIVDLKEIPGHKRLHVTKWAMKLNPFEWPELWEEYKGPKYEIEREFTSWVGNLPVLPHPVAYSVYTRIVAELGALTGLVTAAALVVGGLLAVPPLIIAGIIFTLGSRVLWPIGKPLLKLSYGFLSKILEGSWDFIVELFEGGIFSKVYELYAFGGISASLQLLMPILSVLLIMVLGIRFTLSRRPKNFKLWDMWQGIEFSRSKAEARVDGSTGVKFSDIAGIDEAVEELQELVRYLKNPKLFDQMGIKPPHGVLLEGPPGCGKTLIAKAIAGEAGVPFYQMAGSEFVEVLVGVGSARIRDLFKRAKVNKPSVIFVDEIDAVAARREGTFNDSSNEMYNAAVQERETTLNQLLIELDGFDTGKGVIFLAATNRMDLLDPALLRPGRFDRKIRIRAPNSKGRFEILKVHSRKVKMSKSVDLAIYAQDLPGWTGAMLAQLVQVAALVAVRKGHTEVLPPDMDDAVDRLTLGPKQFGLELSHEGQCRRATNEVGVAIASHLLRRLECAKVERCDRISIIPRGQTLSQIVFHRLDDESYKFERRPQLLHRLQVFLGGRAAEDLIFGGDTSTISSDYLAHASWLARKMLTVWNLENPMTVHGESPSWKEEVKFVGPRLDFEGSLYDDYGMTESSFNLDLDDKIARRTEELVGSMYEKVLGLLRQHQAALLKTVKVLLHKKEITGEEIDVILDKYPADMPVTPLLQERDPHSIPFSQDTDHVLLHPLDA